jgi:hypothetical protein
MKCKYCNNNKPRISATKHYTTGIITQWLSCSVCENVIHEIPDHIPIKQHRNYIISYFNKYESLKCKKRSLH